MEGLGYFGGKPVRDTPLHYGRQFIDQEDIEAVVRVMKSDFLTCGPELGLLEKRLCSITGAKYAVALSNGTAALHGALYAAGITEGDEVITTPITFAASANCALYCGARPVFADIDGSTYNIAADKIEEAVTERTKAVVAVDFAGQAVDLEAVLEVCRRHGLVLVEDGAHSLGTCYKGRPVGSIADLTTFSFHPVKTVTGGEGGAVVTDNREYYERLLLFRAHGITRAVEKMAHPSHGPWYYEQVNLGYNFRMTDIQAALISSQLNKLEMFKQRRRQIVDRYNEAFRLMEEVVVPREIQDSHTVWHLYVLQLKLEALKADRKTIFCALEAENILCNVHYIPIYYFPYYEGLGYQRGICPRAEGLYERILTLPLYYGMTDGDVEDVIHGVKKVLSFYSAAEIGKEAEGGKEKDEAQV